MKKKIKWSISIIFLIILFVWGAQSMQNIMTPAIGVLEIEGSIRDALVYLDAIKVFEENEHVKAVLVRIDSPGGKVGPSQEIYGALLRLKGKKPVIASMGSVGASGGYYIACAADTIFALPGTLTGSIGVILEFLDVSDGLEMIGVKAESITSGALKDSGSPFKEMTDTEREYFMELVSDVHEQFVETVAETRGLPLETVKNYADGRAFTGRQACEFGLIDKLGGFDEAVEEAKEQAGIPGKVRFIRPEISTGILDAIRKMVDVSSPLDLRGTASAFGRLVRIEYRME
ncbi:MAG: signal peptide peptidase SppA [Desulfomonilia bacterium]